jgi:hypothetical protein
VKENPDMRKHGDRRTVDLSGYPDLVVVYLGMRVNRITGLKTLMGLGPKISSSASAKPEGLLHHEILFYSIFPMHFGIRQYWRDVGSLLGLDTVRSAPAMVASLPEGFGWNRVLA